MVELLANLKILLGIAEIDTTNDNLLQLLINDVTEYLCNITNRTDLEIPQTLIRSLTVIKYNQLGSEGLSAETYSGITNTFINGIPEQIKAEIKALRRVKF